MEKVEKYRDCIKQVLTKYAAYKPSYGEVDVQVVFDTEHNHYQV
ncbi:MAG: element excision factor XisI family protein, partial [Microcoleus sp.]